MTQELWVAAVVGISGAVAALVALVANTRNRRVDAGATVAAMMAQLAEDLRDELTRERELRTRLEARVLQLESQLYEAGLVPAPRPFQRE